MHLQDALGQFQVQLAADGRSEHTRKQYERHVRLLIAWLIRNNRPTILAELTPQVVATFVGSADARAHARGGTKKATSQNALRTSVRCLFRWAHEAGFTTNNAARVLRRARCAPPLPRGLHPDEVQRLLDVLKRVTGAEGERDSMLIRLLLGTGVRIGSAVQLDVEDLDLLHGEARLRTTKNDRPATAILPATLVEELRRFLAGRTTGPVFLAGDHRITVRHAQRRLAGWFRAAGVRGSAHGLRHTFATTLLGRTGDLRLVQAALNHASIVSTTVYAGIDRSRLRAAVGA